MVEETKHPPNGKVSLIRATRSFGSNEATGEVEVKGDEQQHLSASQHVALAGACAWLALGKRLLNSDDIIGATGCARHGLAELGNSYSIPTLKDDTRIAIYKAEDHIKSGRFRDGAETLIRVLEARIGIYERKYVNALASSDSS